MGVQNEDTHALEIMLTGSNNRTLRGFLNFTALETGALQDEEGMYDSKGAATFVVVVILVYGLSIVLMIGSLAKKNMKMKDADAEEKQIHIYLNQASDIKEKGAKENYRQLKRNIISIVNKSPASNLMTPTNVSYDRDLKTNAIRSLIAVGGPLAVASTGAAKGAAINGDENNDSVHSTAKRGRQTSDSDSLQALLEEDEPSESPKNSPMTTQPQVTPDSGLPDMYFTGTHLKLPKDTIVITHTSGLQPHVSIAPHPKQTTQQKDTKSQVSTRHIPRLVVPDQQVGRNRRSDRFLKPLDIARARDTRLSSLEPDNKIICNVDGSSLQDTKQSCKLSMDVDGNIWILQSSPNSSRSGVALSPSTSTPGSIGYESFKGITSAPTPSPNPRQSPAINEEKLQSAADAVEGKPISPSYRREESASPAPSYSCFEPKRQLVRTFATSVGLGEERNRRQQQNATPPDTFSFLDGKPNTVTSSPQQDPRSYSCQPSVPHMPFGDTDDEELVQITSV